jgi:hypothetical protein
MSYNSFGKRMTLIDAIKKVLEEDPRTRMKEYNWMFIAKALREMGFKIFIEFDPRMPSPETLFRERREILNKRNTYSEDYKMPDNITIEKPGSFQKS